MQYAVSAFCGRTRLIFAALPVLFGVLSTLPALTQQPADNPLRDAAVTRAVDHDVPAIIELRHHIHQYPELSNREFETSKLVATRPQALGLEVQTGIAHTGVVGILKGGRPGPIIAVRSELDALPVTEATSFPFKSTVRTTYNGQDAGVSHACGHDIHIAAILGVATVLASMREKLPGTVMFIFQPAEEGPPGKEEGGASLMLKEGLFSKLKPEAVFGMHSAVFDVGQIRYSVGPTAASDTNFHIELHGKQAHAAFPQLSIDPVLMAAETEMELQTIRSRSLSPYDPGVISVTMMHTGVRANITPAEATLDGTIRVFDGKNESLIRARMQQIVESVAKGAGGSATVQFDDQNYVPVLISDPALVHRMVPVLERVVGAGNVQQTQPAMAADDFAYFSQLAPSFFFMLGIQKPGTVSGINHTPDFQADDSAIPIGMRAMTEVLLDYLDNPSPHPSHTAAGGK